MQITLTRAELKVVVTALRTAADTYLQDAAHIIEIAGPAYNVKPGIADHVATYFEDLADSAVKLATILEKDI